MGKVFRAFMMDSPNRRFVGDAALPTSVAPSSRNGPVRKTLICSYTGGNFIAERDDSGALNVFYVGTEPLTNMVEDKAACGCGSSMDEGRMTAARLQERSLRLRATGR